MSTYVILPAAGQGRRMGKSLAKQYMEICGAPILVWAVRAFNSHPAVDGIIIAAPPGDEQRVMEMLELYGSIDKVQVTSGGADRQASVANALAMVPETCEIVLVHDAARPLVSHEVIDRVIAQAAHGAVTAAIPVHETIKVANGDLVEKTLDRSSLWSIQTPQGFPRSLIVRAHQEASSDRATDDCALVERLGEKVKLVSGAPENIKVTTPTDLAVATTHLESRSQTALSATPHSDDSQVNATHVPGVGIGYDVHQLVEGRQLVLGGVSIPSARGLLGHSDADVLLHAVMDALLGAAGLGDIGRHFPDNDQTYKGISSLLLLKKTAEILAAKGLRALGVDVVLIAEKPRIAPHVPSMRANIAAALALPETAVNIKATTNERLGFLGREEGIAAQAVARVQ